MSKLRIGISVVFILLTGFILWDKFMARPVEIMEEDPLAVTITSVKKIAKPNELLLSGSVEGFTSSIISSRIEGKVEAVLVEDGHTVEKGQELVRLERIVQENDIIIAKNAVQQQVAKYQNDFANFQRYEVLYQKGACSKQQMEALRTELLVSEANLESAKAVLNNAHKQLKDTTIISPVAGVIANKQINLGQIIMAGEKIMTLEQIDSVHILLQVEQKYIGNLNIGDEVAINVDTYPDKVFIGKINVISPVANNENRLFKIKVKLENSKQLIKPGMFVQAKIKLGASTDVLAIPQEAVLGQKGLQYVYTVVDGKAKRLRIDTGDIINEYLEVNTALPIGTPIVINNLDKVKEGDKLLIGENDEFTGNKH